MESSVGKSVENTYKEFDVHLRYSTFWSRFEAGFIDVIFIYALSYVFQLFLPDVTNTYAVTFLTFLPFIYSIGMHGHSGQTFGKKIAKVKVTNSKDEKSITYFQAFLRDLIPIIGLTAMVVMSFYTPEINTVEDMDEHKSFFRIMAILGATNMIWYVSEFVTMLFNKKRRAVHDYIASTVVVRT